MTTPKVYTPEQVSEILQITRDSVYLYLRSGKLKASRIGRFWRISEKNLNDFIEQGAKAPTSDNN